MKITDCTLARAHGVFNLMGGAWPLVHMPSFEKVLGPKVDKWLVQAVAGLLVTVGAAQLKAADTGEGLAVARDVGAGTAGTLLAIDLAYAPSGRISRMYLLDAAAQACWVGLWLRARRHSARHPGDRRDAAAGAA
jgi:hypothetical protein